MRILNWHEVVNDRLGKDAVVITFCPLCDTALSIRFERKASRATAHTADGKQLPAVVGCWFAWYAFNPKTAVFRAGEQASPKPGR